MQELEKRLDYQFKDINLLNVALIHRSYANERNAKGVTDNERLEFLGDAVLQLCISDFLMKRYPDYAEGRLSKLRSSLVNEKPLAELAVEFNIGDYMLLGKGEENSGGRTKQSLLSNTLEAVIAAVYLDGGLAECDRFIKRYFTPMIDNGSQRVLYTDYKTALQEKSQKLYKETPAYSLVEESGPDHDKTFSVEMTLAGSIKTTGSGKNKKVAEQEAARKALELIHDMEKNLPESD